MKAISTKNPPVIKREKSRKSTKDKKKQLALTNQWLDENYCICDGVCIPRCILYSQYLDFCQAHSLFPACAATFGKIIRQKFPNITTRRLGTRGHSKYHYYGICIKETSQYYHSLYSGGGLTRFSGSKFLNEGGFTRKYFLSSQAGLSLPDFPSCYNFNLPANINHTKLETFLMMYKGHSQCILDCTIATQYKEIPAYLTHFWQGIPDYLVPLFDEQLIINLIAYCDTLLYNSLIDVLVPASMQEVSQQLLSDIQRLASHWEGWMSHSLQGLPLPFFNNKLAAAQNFVQTLRRQSTFLNLAQMVRPTLYDCQMVNQMISDINADQVQASVMCDSQKSGETSIDAELFSQLKEVLQKQATVEAFTEWIDATLTQKVIKPSGNNHKLFKKKAHTFLVSWSRFSSGLIQALTMRNSTSLESINLLRLLMDEYIMVAIESQIQERTTQELVTELQQFLTPSSIANSSNSSGLGACLSYQHNMAHTHTQEHAIPINNEMRLRPIPFQQGPCGYSSLHSEQINPSQIYTWHQNMHTYGDAIGAAAALPYMREYDVRRREHVAHHLYQPYSATVDGMMRHSHEFVAPEINSNFDNIPQEGVPHLPPIGHVLY